MDSKAPVALGIGIGYLLGRKHRLKWALLLGAAAATGQLGGVSGQMLRRGGDLLRSSPELAKFADSMLNLLTAGRGVAISAMNSKVESLQQKAQLGGATSKLSDEVGRRRPGAAADEDDEYDEDYDDEKDDDVDRDDEDDDRDGGRVTRDREGERRREPAVRRTGRTSR
jgi:hypothetical protein